MQILSSSLCTAVEGTSQMDSDLWGSFSSTHFYLHVLVIQRVERFARSSSSLPETTLVSSRTLSFCFPLIAFSLTSFNTTLTPAIRNHCSCLNSLIPGVKVSQSEFLIYASLHHRLQFLTIGHRFLLLNFHVIQFQYGFELIRLTYSQFVQTFQDVIMWDLGQKQ